MERVNKKESCEARNYKVIREKLREEKITPDPALEHIILRVICATGDLSYAGKIIEVNRASEKIAEAFKNGCYMLTDSKMVQAGIDKEWAEKLNSKVMCFSGARDVIEEGKRLNRTPEWVSMRKALLLESPIIFCIGEEPTAIGSVMEMVENGEVHAAGIVATPAGFTNAPELKAKLKAAGVPSIIAEGESGGANVAAAIVNAIQYSVGL